jgi:hypothetical protein
MGNLAKPITLPAWAPDPEPVSNNNDSNQDNNNNNSNQDNNSDA